MTRVTDATPLERRRVQAVRQARGSRAASFVTPLMRRSAARSGAMAGQTPAVNTGTPATDVPEQPHTTRAADQQPDPLGNPQPSAASSQLANGTEQPLVAPEKVANTAAPTTANPVAKPCARCGQTAVLRCGTCRLDWYCGKQCQRLWWKQTHKWECVPHGAPAEGDRPTKDQLPTMRLKYRGECRCQVRSKCKCHRGYLTEPPLEELRQWSVQQLRRVVDFKVCAAMIGAWQPLSMCYR